MNDREVNIEVCCLEPLDYESIPGGKINLTVTAKDVDNLHSTTYLLIHVLDENDNSPVFLQSLNFTVKEVFVT